MPIRFRIQPLSEERLSSSITTVAWVKYERKLNQVQSRGTLLMFCLTRHELAVMKVFSKNFPEMFSPKLLMELLWMMISWSLFLTTVLFLKFSGLICLFIRGALSLVHSQILLAISLTSRSSQVSVESILGPTH